MDKKRLDDVRGCEVEEVACDLKREVLRYRLHLSWEKVEPRTSDFIAWLNERLASIDSMTAPDIHDLSFEAHFRLGTIHPWSDGNGRVARLVMNLVQMEGGVVPTAVRSDHKVRYIEALRESQETGSSERFHDFMADELVEALSQTVEEYARDAERDVPWLRDDGSNNPSIPQVTPKSKGSSPLSAARSSMPVSSGACWDSRMQRASGNSTCAKPLTLAWLR